MRKYLSSPVVIAAVGFAVGYKVGRDYGVNITFTKKGA